MEVDPTLEARSAVYSPWGKATNEIKVRLPDEVKFAAERKASELGIPLGEYLRELVIVNIFGVEHAVSVHAKRLQLVATIGAEIGTIK